MLRHFQQLSYPIAQYATLPTVEMIHRLISVDALGFVALAFGVWVGGWIFGARVGGRSPSVRLPEAAQRNAESLLAKWAVRLLLIGLAGSAVLVGVTRSVAVFDSNIDKVRYTQGVGLGFATLAQYELVGAGVIACVLALTAPRYRRLGVTIAVASVVTLTATRAGRTPILVMAFGVLVVLRLLGKRVRVVPVFVVTAALIFGALYLGIFRLQSQSGPLTGKEEEVRALLDVSPEVREQAFVFSLFPTQAPYLGRDGVLPIGLGVLPGKLLALANIDKQSLNQDSSHIYTATMDRLQIYRNTKPIRVGLTGELWMDAGPVGLIIGMVLYGLVGSGLAAWRTSTPMRVIGRGLASTLYMLALVTPLAVLSAASLMTLLPFLIARDAAATPSSRATSEAVS
jgi:hypothetical protein